MKIRWKLLILLLVMTVLPIVAVRVIDAATLYRYAKRIAATSRANLLHSAQLELRDLLSAHAAILTQEDHAISTMLEVQARAIEERYAKPVPGSPMPVYFTEQFVESASNSPPGLRTDPRYNKAKPDGLREPLPISDEAQAVRVHPEVERGAVAEDVARLADMTEVYRYISERFPDSILWQYTSLETGVHFSYPGKGGYDADYDSRQRLWYIHTKRSGLSSWYPPSYDATTGQVVLTQAAPLRNANGEFIGVTAIDVPLSALIGQPKNSAPWAESSKSMSILMAPLSVLQDLGFELEDQPAAESLAEDVQPVILMNNTLSDSGGDWRQRIGLTVLQVDDPAVMAEVRADFLNGRSNVREVTVEGQHLVWAYSPVDEEGPAVLLISVPYDQITKQADALERDTLDEMFASLQRSAMAVLVIIVLVVGVALIASRNVSKPVVQLATAARDIADGKLDARVDLGTCHRGNELHDMADAFNAMVPKLRDQMSMRQSLELAMEVQQALLPAGPPKLTGFDIAGNSIYCDETGGDYYDFIDFEQIGPDRLLVIVGDVVGHGVAAALLMATVRALVRSRAIVPGTLAGAIGDVNHQLCLSRFTGRFMTAFCLVIDKSDHELRWVSAGHDPALVYDSETDTFSELAGEDIPIGLQADWRFNQFQRAGFKAGEVIVMGTDGIWECRNADDQMFGKDRLKDLIRRHAAEPAADIANAIQQAVRDHRGDRDQQDDITLVVVKVVA